MQNALRPEMRPNRRTGLYIHWPFCAAKCPYCDFNSHVRESINMQDWQRAMLSGLDYYAGLLPGRRIDTVFFGGGTPSLMEPSLVSAILDHVQKRFSIANDLEVTLEANPTSVEAEKFKAFRVAGVNRVSLGVQSLDDAQLAFLGRKHSAVQARDAINLAANIFERYSFDLIYARPDQTLAQWEAELRESLELARGHMSLYQLTIERRTPFYLLHKRGEFTMPEENLAADFYHLTQDIMEEVGLPAYEVSNHAAPGQECRHNLIYWDYEDYIGLGPGAHGRLSDVSVWSGAVKFATREHSVPEEWLRRTLENPGSAMDVPQSLGAQDAFEEGFIVGLRQRGGLDLSVLSARFGVDWRSVLEEGKIAVAAQQGWLIFEDAREHLTLTREGWLRLNALAPYLLK